MTCPSQYSENNSACIECIFSGICQEHFEEALHQQLHSDN